jgi:REP element-mobilizing transposase RayT
MPNHVHAIVRPFDWGDDPVEEILRTWKGTTARRINERAGDDGSLWQRESFDRIIRDEEHLWRVLQYIGSNPRNAKLREGEYVLWMNPEWTDVGWKVVPAKGAS